MSEMSIWHRRVSLAMACDTEDTNFMHTWDMIVGQFIYAICINIYDIYRQSLSSDFSTFCCLSSVRANLNN
uniref:Uncharacterized protein n=1 Tax=Manihot esculenta TaxID=3983 RepID=A0A2C9VQ24_MANES